MFLISFKVTSLAILELFILGFIGFFLVKRKLLSYEGLDNLSRLVMEVTLPLFIISRLIKDFSFLAYPQWWLYPLLAIAITGLGFLIALPFLGVAKDANEKRQILTLVGFQNSGYLPLPLVAALLSGSDAAKMFIYIFLFLVGFNLFIWSFGPYILSYHKQRRFEFGSLFSPPVVATFIGMGLVFFGLNNFIPGFIFRPLKLIGDCTLPLAIFVVGGSLAQIELKDGINKKAIFFIILAKLILMPAIILFILGRIKVDYLLGVLLLIQGAMPSATSLSIIIRQNKEKDSLINPAIFFTHLLGIFTVPLFLTLFFLMVK
jgi:hypothetical protein